jgi:hypothetical protein
VALELEVTFADRDGGFKRSLTVAWLEVRRVKDVRSAR